MHGVSVVCEGRRATDHWKKEYRKPMTVETAIASKNILGEGPWWSVKESALYWIDIKGKNVQRWHSETGDQSVWNVPHEIGCFVMAASGRGLLAMQNGLHYLDLVTNELTPIVDPEEEKPGNRFNDGICDRRGRFWLGTMDNEEEGTTGALYRFDPDQSIHKIRGDVGISNGLGWSPDDRVMYYADSPARVIYAYDYDIDRGEATGERVFVEVDHGFPDGLTVDSEGYVWSAQWGAWRVVRYAPDGTVDRIVQMPVEKPTSCMFGGPELKDLYVTSARIKLTPEALARQPDAGNVFRIQTDVAGLPEAYFAG